MVLFEGSNENDVVYKRELSLLSDLGDIEGVESCADVKFVASDGSFVLSHRILLSLFSKHMKELFSTVEDSGEWEQVVITEFDQESLMGFVELIYSGQTITTKSTEIQEILSLFCFTQLDLVSVDCFPKVEVQINGDFNTPLEEILQLETAGELDLDNEHEDINVVIYQSKTRGGNVKQTQSSVPANTKQPSSLYQCSVCDKSFGSLKSVKRHEHTHAKSDTFSFSRCTETYIETASGKERLKQSTDETAEHPDLETSIQTGPAVCDVCKKGYSSQKYLRYHIRKVHLNEDVPIQKCVSSSCPFCHIMMSSVGNLRRHIRNVHKDKENSQHVSELLAGSNDNEIADNIDISNSLTCDICHKQLKNRKSLSYHRRRQHLGSIPDRNYIQYDCPVCSLRVSNITNLKRHIVRVHGPRVLQKLINDGTVVHKPHMSNKSPSSDESCSILNSNDLEEGRPLSSEVRNSPTATDGFLCEMCKKPYRTQKSLLYHQRLIHLGSVAKQKYKPYFCTICDLKLSSICCLKLHVKRRHGLSALQKEIAEGRIIALRKHCPHCEAVFNSREKLQEHLRDAHDLEIEQNASRTENPTPAYSALTTCRSANNSIKCESNKVKIPRTVVKEQTKVNIKCVLCQDSVFSRHNAFAMHIGTMHKVIYEWRPSLSKKPWHKMGIYHIAYNCGDCDYVSADILQFNSHQQETSHSLISPLFKCTLCGSRFLDDKEAKVHFVDHGDTGKLKRNQIPDGEKSILCHLCYKVFSNNGKLKEHLLRHDVEDGKIEKPHSCQVCSRRFLLKKHLTSHMAVHLSSGKYKCDVPGCGKAFALEHRLLTHQRQHSGEIRFECVPCGKVFTDHTGLRYHKLVVHDRSFPFRCHICDKSFARSLVLRNHMLTHDPNPPRPYLCQVCGYAAVSKTALSWHKRKHKEGRRKQCTLCNASFSRLCGLKVHMMKVHE